jgi:cell division protein FtsW
MPGNSTQRNFLSHPYSDFIFAIILEEYGLLGGAFVVLLYMILLFRAVRIVTKIPRTFGAFLTIGVAFSLVFQALITLKVGLLLIKVTFATGKHGWYLNLVYKFIYWNYPECQQRSK